MDSAENLIEQVNYEALMLKVEGISDLNLCLSDDDFFREKLEEIIEALELLESQIGPLGLSEHFDWINKKNREHLQLIWLMNVMRNAIKDFIVHLLCKNANRENLVLGMGGVGNEKRVVLSKGSRDLLLLVSFRIRAWSTVPSFHPSMGNRGTIFDSGTRLFILSQRHMNPSSKL